MATGGNGTDSDMLCGINAAMKKEMEHFFSKDTLKSIVEVVDRSSKISHDPFTRPELADTQSVAGKITVDCEEEEKLVEEGYTKDKQRLQKIKDYGMTFERPDIKMLKSVYEHSVNVPTENVKRKQCLSMPDVERSGAIPKRNFNGNSTKIDTVTYYKSKGIDAVVSTTSVRVIPAQRHTQESKQRISRKDGQASMGYMPRETGTMAEKSVRECTENVQRQKCTKMPDDARSGTIPKQAFNADSKNPGGYKYSGAIVGAAVRSNSSVRPREHHKEVSTQIISWKAEQGFSKRTSKGKERKGVGKLTETRSDRNAVGDEGGSGNKRETRSDRNAVGDEGGSGNKRETRSDRNAVGDEGGSGNKRETSEADARMSDEGGGQKSKFQGKPKNGNVRRSSNGAQSEAEFLVEKVSKQTPVTLYVVVPQLLKDNFDIEGFLLARMQSEIARLDISNRVCVGDSTIVYINFASKSVASRMANILKMSNRGSQTKLLCTFVKTVAHGQPVQNDENEFKAQLLAITKRAERAMNNHDEKIKLASMKIHTLSGNKFVIFEEFEQRRAEKIALQDKVEELGKQKEQFASFLKSLHSKLNELWRSNTYSKYISDLRREFGVECCRLESALPIYARRNDIIRMVKENQVCVILGETGSGKSTQMVQYLNQAGFSKNGIIACTQPRKVAAISLATHVSSEVVTHVGNVVGYKVGMRAKCGGATKILYMTDHCLLNECLKDPKLSAYSCIIVDEAHERSIYTDLLLGMLKSCLKQRPELRAIITSATIDPDVFVNYFGGCPVLKVSGRMFPVDVVYQEDNEGKLFDNYLDEAVSKAVEIHKSEPPGDILVFVTSPLETEKSCSKLKERLQGRTDFKCLILHGQIQPEEQQLVFKPTVAAIRKIVFATNSAETSITIPGIKYVIDTGLVKEKRYDPKRNVSSLSVVTISRSSADQRKGRAGRTGPGKCIRLYSEQMYKDMDAVSVPEILKVHLGQALLKLTDLGINPSEYDFVQSPGSAAISTAMETLEELGAVKDGIITEEGKELASLPVEPRLGLMIQKGRAQGAYFDAIVLAAVSSSGGSIFFRGGSDNDKKKADQLKMQFSHAGGDTLSLLNVYREWVKQPEKVKNKWCFTNSINSKAIRSARDNVNEIATMLKKESNKKDPKLKIEHVLGDAKDVDDKLQKILFESFTGNLCHYFGRARAGYYSARLDQQVHAHPSSVINPLNMAPEWLVFEQSLKTSKDFITGITPVDESWVREAVESGRLRNTMEEMQNKTLTAVHTECVGSFLFQNIVGPAFTKLRTIEEKAKDIVQPDLAVVEASRERGELKVFCSENSANKLKHIFTDVTQPIKESLFNARIEVPLSHNNEQSGIRVVVGNGGSVKDILMSDEYCTVFIDKPTEDATAESILAKFGRFGKIVSHRSFRNPYTRWGCVTYESAAAAREAVHVTKIDNSEVAVPEKMGGGYQDSKFKVKIIWCRRTSKGFGFADIAPEEVPRLLGRTLMVKGRMIDVKLGRKSEQSLYLGDLGSDVTEDDIKKAIVNFLGSDCDVVERVTVVREKVENTSKEELELMKQELQLRIEEITPADRFTLNLLPPPKPTTVFFHAFAMFSNAEEGIDACQTLSRKMFINGRVVTMEPQIRSSLYVNKEVYKAIKQNLDTYVKEFAEFGYSEVSISRKTLRNGTIVIDINASSTLDLAKVRANLQEIFQGEVLECGSSPELKHFFTRTGREFLRELEKTLDAYIQFDGRNLTISIRGKHETCSRVKIAMNDYLQDLAEGQCKEINLREKGKPNGLMKVLMIEYGLELEKFQKLTGLRSVILKFKQQIVQMSGSRESIHKGTAVIGEVCSTLIKNAKVSGDEAEENFPDCCICFTTVEPNELYRLEYCGHAYCMSCVKMQTEYAIRSREFPIVCGYDGCGCPLVWRDLSHMQRCSAFTLPILASSCVHAFVMKNTKAFKYCLTPNCCMVYRATSTGSVFVCPDCTMRICTTCHVQFHEGLTCSMYTSAQTVDGSLEAFLQTHSTTTKKCPNCETPIEKIDGCNSMCCTGCTCHFCWLCLAFFKTSKGCYTHLSQKHGGYF